MADMVPQGVQREGKNGGYEHGDANIRAVVVTMSVIMGTVFLVMLVIGGMSYALDKREESHDVALSAVYERPIPPEPRLLPSRAAGEGDPYDKQPWELGQEEREAQLKAATTPYWINKERGQVSIPVPQALEDVARQGLPATQPRGANEPSFGDDLVDRKGVGSQDVADADLDGTMVPDTTGGRAMSDVLIQAPSLGMEPHSATSALAANQASGKAPRTVTTNAATTSPFPTTTSTAGGASEGVGSASLSTTRNAPAGSTTSAP